MYSNCLTKAGLKLALSASYLKYDSSFLYILVSTTTTIPIPKARQHTSLNSEKLFVEHLCKEKALYQLLFEGAPQTATKRAFKGTTISNQIMSRSSLMPPVERERTSSGICPVSVLGLVLVFLK